VIVGFGHQYQVGKDTAAQALCKELGFRRVGFADKLKALALEVDPLVTSATRAVNVDAGRGRLKWTVQGLGWDEAKRHHPEVRAVLQRLGVGAREVFGEDFWIEQALGGAHSVAKIVVPDVRFLNEAEAIKARGGILIKITRPGHHGDGHVSETELNGFDGWDHVIHNQGSIAELEQTVVRLVREEIQKQEASDA
jgi:hypothetical protein